MASRRYKYRHRSLPAPGKVRAVLDGYAALSGTANADATGANAHKCGQAVSALPASATVPGVVSRLWEAATCADMTPARTYLSRRGCWPGRHVRVPLPAQSVRWLAREAAPERDEAAGWYGLPPGAVGAVVFAWRRPLRGFERKDGPLVAVTLVALDARGFPVPEARSTVGPTGGAVFRAGDRGDVGAVTVQADDEGQLHAANGWLETPWLEVLGGTER